MTFGSHCWLASFCPQRSEEFESESLRQYQHTRTSELDLAYERTYVPQEILQLFETPLVFRREEGTVVLQEQETILDKLGKRLCQRPFLLKK